MSVVRGIGGRVDRDKRNGRDDLSRLEPKAIEGRVPPQDMTAEAATICCVLLDPPRIKDLLWLKSRHFFSEAHARIWEAILELHLTGSPVDIVTVATFLKDNDRIAQVGGISYLTEITNAAPFVAHVERYARIVVEKWRARNFIARAQQIAAEGYFTDDVRAYIAESERSILEVSRDLTTSLNYKSYADLIAPIPDRLPWLLEQLRIIRGRANMFAGFPFSGKTLIAQEIALCVATGRQVFGLWHPQCVGRVSHLNYDQPWLDTRIRYARLMRAKHLAHDALLDEHGKLNLRVYQYPEAYLDRDEHIAEIRAIMRESVLVVIDALTGAVEDTEENSPAMGKLIYRLNKLSEETGCTVLIVHHAKKTTQAPRGRKSDNPDDGAKLQELMQMIRGSSSIFGAVGSAFVLEPTGKRKPILMHHVKTPALSSELLDQFGIRFVDCDERSEDLTTGVVTHLTNVGVRIEHLDPEQLAELRKADKKRSEPADGADFEQKCVRVLEVIKANPIISGKSVKAHVPKMAKDTVYACLEHLKRTGRVVSENGPRNAALWRAT